MRHRRLRKALRNIGLSAAVSDMALIGANLSSLDQAGMNPHRRLTHSRPAPAARTAGTGCVGATLYRGATSGAVDRPNSPATSSPEDTSKNLPHTAVPSRRGEGGIIGRRRAAA
jgi:hypothetical protein